MITLETIKDYLKKYDGEELTFMEVCGTHTAAISQSGITEILSDKIRLVSGPGCPVCVTVASYIDKLVSLSMEENTCVATFGDMLRVRGSEKSLNDAKASGGKVILVYSPMDVIDIAKKNTQLNYVFAAVGFETTTPIYSLMLKQIIEEKIENLKLLTALKTMPKVIDWVCSVDSPINGFIAPGHVSVITGSDYFKELALKWNMPFVVSGFEAIDLLNAIYALINYKDKGEVLNLYPAYVTDKGNKAAQKQVEQYFTSCKSAWRGIGQIEDSGMQLKEEYLKYDAGSQNLIEDSKINEGCCCDKVIIGTINPTQCPLFKKVCSPETPQGACMVSTEGSCYHYYISNRKR
ncbi:hydrogenase formation protein HypD [Anaerosacchariphilus polymeriproducens]|uniref:Hydrogenase formation protein HypD n=1 Tax=Anaerosacchariphilus polymeriproducens TaxID=1812858 RepID=A0A371ATS4_9FIRM|nr:hydrogenase formation protein HypD [Anaerosacchariphilus polymeriproducens]RDU22967.1 hydrogenase formation protein HypD [Anaerosacchariphilus polymeriproducens]